MKYTLKEFEERMKRLQEEYGIQVSNKFKEEAIEMCNISDYFKQEGIDLATLKNIQDLMKNLRLPLDQILNAL